MLRPHLCIPPLEATSYLSCALLTRRPQLVAGVIGPVRVCKLPACGMLVLVLPWPWLTPVRVAVWGALLTGHSLTLAVRDGAATINTAACAHGHSFQCGCSSSAAGKASWVVA